MEFKRKVRKFGKHSIGIIIPSDLIKYLDLDGDDEIIIVDQKGKHGPFIALWKQNKENKENKEKRDDTNGYRYGQGQEQGQEQESEYKPKTNANANYQ